MPGREAVARWLPWAGRLVAVLALGFLVWKARENWGALSAWTITPQVVCIVAAAVVGYGVVLMLLAESWHRLVSGVSKHKLSRFVTWPSFGLTQVAKYLPGNVFHYVGRHFYLVKLGVSHKASLTAMGWEAAILCVAATVCASIGWLLSPFLIFGVPHEAVRLTIAALAAALVVGLTATLVLRARSPRLEPLIPPAAALFPAGVVLLAFFVGQGAIFASLFLAVGAPMTIKAFAIAGLSWLVGYLTPGAPGGIGSREAVMVGLAAPLVGSADALILAALFRVVTTLGDLVCFGISAAIARRGKALGFSAQAA